MIIDWAMIVSLIVSLIVALGGLGTALATWRRTQVAMREAQSAARKADVEALTETVDALLADNGRLRERIRDLELGRVADRKTIDTLRCQVEKLESENRWFRAQQEELERENHQLRELVTTNVEGC